MTAAQHQQVDALFMQLMEAGDDAAARDAALALINDPDVKAEALSLLQHSSPAGSSVTASVGALMHDAVDAGAFEDRTIGPGTRFERYRIERKLGQGGMGDVYEATRDNDYHKQVALKIVRFGLDSEFARGRFQQERQTLAHLEHPYIARLIDGGEAANGCPYLVLEFVDGVPISDYTHACSEKDILALFLKVCEAVEYAHRNLVIHRDLKPANILVTADGTPKLLDFGIAKLLDTNADVTQTVAVALTPQYASPEQIRNLPITTASDVYSLGVILYQLLTRRKPYQLETVTAAELDRIVCEQPPASPAIGNELDDILLMALRKEPDRRYASVAALAEDVRRFLANEPVLAAPDTLWYRTRKYVLRHALPLSALAAVLLAVAVGAGVAWQQARIARARFDQVRSLAHSFVFDFSDDLAKIQGTTGVREKMVSTALRYLDSLSKSASNDVELQKELVGAYQKVGEAQGSPTLPNLGHPEAALVSYRKSAEIGEAIVRKDPSYALTLGVFYTDFSLFLLRTGDLQGARSASEMSFHTLERVGTQTSGQNLQQLAFAWCGLGDIEEDTGREASALIHFQRCDALAQQQLASSRTMDTLRLAQQAKERLSTSTLAAGDIQGALAVVDQDEALIREQLRSQPANPRFLRTLALVSQYRAEAWFDDIYPSAENPTESLKYAQQYLDVTQKRANDDPKDQSARLSFAIALFRISFPLQRLNPALAVSKAQESVHAFDAILADGNRTYLVRSRRNRALRRWAEALLADGHAREAAEKASEAIESERTIVREHPDNADEVTCLALLLKVRGLAAAAMGDRAYGMQCLTEAEHLMAGLYAQAQGELRVAVPLSAIREEMATQRAAAGDREDARQWLMRTGQLWTAIGGGNAFVQGKIAAINQRLKTFETPGSAPFHTP